MLKIGQQAPNFETTTESGERFRLSDLRGKKVALVWYVKDNTSGCQAQVCSLRDNYDWLRAQDVEVFAIAPGSQKTHRSFKEKNNLQFPLLMDEKNKIAEKYGVWGEKQMYGKKYIGTIRTSFLIDEEGIVASIIGGPEGVERVKTKNHTEQIARVWGLKL
ncbi:MAG: peroxiredoxin [Candidatus Thorarchaeota archaeon]|nr:MAG: peroxiredoxin [Candidatus Thorarchaeota archaeon]RLI59419.1 MAG: peroxiredoxin [Candidatus Thorarchaeota archaeon]